MSIEAARWSTKESNAASTEQEKSRPVICYQLQHKQGKPEKVFVPPSGRRHSQDLACPRAQPALPPRKQDVLGSIPPSPCKSRRLPDLAQEAADLPHRSPPRLAQAPGRSPPHKRSATRPKSGPMAAARSSAPAHAPRAPPGNPPASRFRLHRRLRPASARTWRWPCNSPAHPARAKFLSPSAWVTRQPVLSLTRKEGKPHDARLWGRDCRFPPPSFRYGRIQSSPRGGRWENPNGQCRGWGKLRGEKHSQLLGICARPVFVHMFMYVYRHSYVSYLFHIQTVS